MKSDSESVTDYEWHRWINFAGTNLSIAFWGVESALTLWAEAKFEKLVELDVTAMLLFDWCEARQLFISGTVVTVTTLVGVHCVVATDVWFK